MEYEKQVPTFYHKRPPVIKNSFQTNNPKSKSRSPISDEQLRKLLLKHQLFKQSHLKKINLKRTLLTHLAYQKNFEESIQYNKIKLNNHTAVKVLLVDGSYSMKDYHEAILTSLKNIEHDVILFHDQYIFECIADDRSFLPKFSGGTSFYQPLKQIEQTKIKVDILHVTDGENSPLDQIKTEQILKRLMQIGTTYRRKVIKEER